VAIVSKTSSLSQTATLHTVRHAKEWVVLTDRLSRLTWHFEIAVAYCVAGPGAKPGAAADASINSKQPLCECAAGYEVATIGDGTWQCNVATGGPSAAAAPEWIWVLCVACLLVSVSSVGVAVRATRKLRSTSQGLQQTLVPPSAQW
jgi:hypothetical protein